MAEPFDPDAYLARKRREDEERVQSAPFDPDAYLARPPPARTGPFAWDGEYRSTGAEASSDDPPAQLARPVGAGETFLTRAADAVPMARPLIAGNAATLSQAARLLGAGKPGARLGPASLEAAQEQGIELEQPQESIGGWVDEYRRIRDERDLRSDVGSAHNPWAGRAGTGLGILTTAAAPIAGVAGGGVSLGRGVGIGAGLGGLQATGDSRADLTRGEIGRQLLDTGMGVALGGAGGALGVGAAKATPALLGWAERLLSGRAMNAGRRALLGGADSLSGRKPVSDAAVREALDSGAIRLGGSTQGASNRLDALRETAGEAYGATLGRLEDLGVRGPNATALARQLRSAGVDASDTTVQSAVPLAFRRMANAVQDKGMVSVGDDAGAIGLRQAEALKRSAQDIPNYQRLMQNSNELNEANKQIASLIRQANEDAVEAAGQRMGGEVAEHADAFVPLKQQLSRLIEASDAAERGSAAAGRRSGSSLTGTILAAGRTGNPVTDDLLSRVMTAFRGRIPSSSAVLQDDLAQALKPLQRSSQLSLQRGTLPRQGALGGGSAAGDLPGVLTGDDEEARSRYESLLRALQEGR